MIIDYAEVKMNRVYLIVIGLFLLIPLSGSTQISGSTDVLSFNATNQSQIYEFNLNRSLSKAKWSVTNGSKDLEFKPVAGTFIYRLGVFWNEPGGSSASGAITFEYEDANGTYSINLPVTIHGTSSPNTTIQTTYACGNTLVTRNTNPANSSTQWYWQTSSGGVRTDLGTSPNLSLLGSSNVYLRSKSTISPYPWGGEQYFGNVSVSTVLPSTPDVAQSGSNYSGAPITLSVNTVAGATGYKWYTQSVGGSPVPGVNSSTYTVSLQSSTTFYVSSVLGPCESSNRLEVTGTVLPLPTNPSLVNINPALVFNSALQNSYIYTFDMSGVAIDHPRWDITGGQVIATGSQGSIYYAIVNWTMEGTGWLAFENDLSPRSITVSTYHVNSPINVNLNPSQSNCGNTTISRSANPNSFEIWYWQQSSDTQTDLGSGSSVTLSEPGELYIRRKWNIYPYPWGTRQSLGNISIIQMPSAPVIANHSGRFGKGEVEVSVDPVVGATSYKWYSTPLDSWTEVATTINSSYLIAELNQTITLYVSIVKGPCENPSRLQVMARYEPLPEIQCGEPCSILQGQPVIISSMQPYASYSWQKSGEQLQGGNSVNFSVTQAGEYTLTVTVSGIPMSGTSLPITIKNGVYSYEKNYIVSNQIQRSGIQESSDIENLNHKDKNQQIDFFDDLGQPEQTVWTRKSPQEKDMIQPRVFDTFGREVEKFLPVTGEASGRFKQDVIVNGHYSGFASNYYSGQDDKIPNDIPSMEVKFESAPSGRLLEEGAPGEAWQIERNKRRISYSVNTSMEVIKFIYVSESGAINVGEGESRFHSPNQIFVNKTYDENNNIGIEYTDKEGRTICKKVQSSKPNEPLAFASTYYIYDDFGNLVVVIPPEGVEKLKTALNLN